MTGLALPAFLVAGVLAAAAIAALHFIVFRERSPRPFPTARFVPVTPATTASRTRTPADLLVMAARALAMLLVGLALAEPLLGARAGRMRTVVVADVSRAVADTAEVRDSVSALLGESGILVTFDTAARVGGLAFAPGRASGSLSAGLVAGIREASKLVARGDSARIVVVSPLSEEELDAATQAIRDSWTGDLRVVKIAGVSAAPALPRVAIRSLADDPLVATLAVLRRGGGVAAGDLTTADVVVVRNGLTARDSPAARDGRVVVHWPAGETTARATATAVSDGTTAAVANFLRLSRAAPPAARVVARWSDGSPAAWENPYGRGCVRYVAVGVPSAGDAALRGDFASVTRTLLAPCGGWQSPGPAADGVISALQRSPHDDTAVAVAQARSSMLPATALIAALALLLLEKLLRRRRPT